MLLLPCQGLCKGGIGITEQLLSTSHPTAAFSLGLSEVTSWKHLFLGLTDELQQL